MRPGDHAFLCYGTQYDGGACHGGAVDGWDVLSAFVWSGLAHGEKVLVIPPPRLAENAVWARIQQAPGLLLATSRASGQLSLTSMRELVGPGDPPTAEQGTQRVREETEAARRDGYSGLRAYIDMGWLDGLGIGPDAMLERERSRGHLFTDGFYSEICAYDRRRFSAAFLDAVCRTHPHNLLSSLGQLHSLHDTGTLRLIGEADMATRDRFLEALSAGLSHTGTGPRLTVDLTGLTFLGTECAADLVDVLGSAPGRRTVRVRCTAHNAALLYRLGANSSDIDVLTRRPAGRHPG
jgi:anti-anti-sigma regulatory factor